MEITVKMLKKRISNMTSGNKHSGEPVQTILAMCRQCRRCWIMGTPNRGHRVPPGGLGRASSLSAARFVPKDYA